MVHGFPKEDYVELLCWYVRKEIAQYKKILVCSTVLERPSPRFVQGCLRYVHADVEPVRTRGQFVRSIAWAATQIQNTTAAEIPMQVRVHAVADSVIDEVPFAS